MNHELLLVEDDIDLGNVMKQYLEINNFSITLCRNGKEGLQNFRNGVFDLCILDVMMPEMDGFSLAKKILQISVNTPFLFLTALNQKSDRMKGLQLGADDYICKPFEIDELVLRVQNILRRTGKSSNIASQQIGNYDFDRSNLLLSLGNNEKRITLQEAKLLELLLQNKNTVVKRPHILTQLWGEDDYFAGRSLDVFISRLRKYLKKDPQLSIENIRGVGFKLNC